MIGGAYDVVVVGGGINGAGVAQAAAAAGYSVLLLEKQALAAGTSSKSSKLVHGGLRYLESLEFGLVRESLKERELLLRLAPDLVQLQEFCVPLYRETRRSPALLRTGLALYYLLSGLAADARFRSVPRGEWPQLDGLRQDNLRAVFSYQDARTDDRALTRAVMASARSIGAEYVCPAEFVGADLHDGGCEVRLRVGDNEQRCAARILVNAAGPWVAEVAALITPAPPLVPVELVQGAHIELPTAGSGFSGRYFYYLESPRDGRAVFVMPRDGRVIIGTTETRGRSDPDRVGALPAEESYLLGVARHYFPRLANRSRGDLVDSWAGLRVLPGGDDHAFHRSRETILQPDRPDRPRAVSIYGGKLTTYRATADKVVDLMRPALPERKPVASTRDLPLSPD